MKISIDTCYSEGQYRDTGVEVPAHALLGASTLAVAIVSELRENDVAKYVEVIRFRSTHRTPDCVVCKVHGELNILGVKKTLSHVLTIDLPDPPKKYNTTILQDDVARFMVGIRYDLSYTARVNRQVLANLDKFLTPSSG
ncbi:MAG TPA: hypothetical protein VG934_00530 [Candidatus Paceibacterota bacterium]|nr:hypothetical protein [Candidatus Paceibacterota bacterium]